MRSRVLFAGPIPPPRNRITGVTETLLDSTLANDFQLAHRDKSDLRPVANVARIDLGKIVLAIWHGVAFAARLLRLVYVPIARNRLGFLRDCCARVREGFLGTVANVETLADRTLRLLTDSDLREQARSAARRRYEQQHTSSAFASRLASVFGALIAENEEPER